MSSHTSLKQYLYEDKEISLKTLIEIGTTREILPDQNSTKYFYDLSKVLGFHFITVDMDKENTDKIKQRLPEINAITQKGEDFLRHYTDRIDYVYLDAFDFYHPHHTQTRIEKYRNLLDTTINDAACHQMHLECCKSLIHKLPSGGIILFDDILNKQFDGKGKTAIPYLLQNNFKLLKIVNNGCILEKK